jgi:hypothetical protein
MDSHDPLIGTTADRVTLIEECRVVVYRYR